MNFAQLHEALRLEILRRIDRGVLTGSILARHTGYKQPHISNFIHGRRRLSLEALDRILASQRLTVTDLMPGGVGSRIQRRNNEARAFDAVHLVSQASAIHSPNIDPHEVLMDVPSCPARSTNTNLAYPNHAAHGIDL